VSDEAKKERSRHEMTLRVTSDQSQEGEGVGRTRRGKEEFRLKVCDCYLEHEKFVCPRTIVSNVISVTL